MNRTEFQDWCKQSKGTEVDGRGQTHHCHLDEHVVTFGGDDMSVHPKSKDSAFYKIEGPADEFFNMGRAQLATQVGDHELVFQK